MLCLVCSCSKNESSSNPDSIVKGKKRFTTTVDGVLREYYVHVPQGHNGTTSFPVVFMLHGTSGDGDKFNNKPGWKEEGDKSNIFTVYPSSWAYCIIDNGVSKTTTKWNVFPGSFT